jgi:hypothetical protein
VLVAASLFCLALLGVLLAVEGAGRLLRQGDEADLLDASRALGRLAREAREARALYEPDATRLTLGFTPTRPGPGLVLGLPDGSVAGYRQNPALGTLERLSYRAGYRPGVPESQVVEWIEVLARVRHLTLQRQAGPAGEDLLQVTLVPEGSGQEPLTTAVALRPGALPGRPTETQGAPGPEGAGREPLTTAATLPLRESP